MTTTTGKTRKAPGAAVLTALLAVLALVFGALAFAGVANAKDDNPNKPDNPGNSQNAPGQENTPPGQDPGDTPGSSHDKMTICHYVEGKGETRAGYNIITMNEQAWAAHLAHHPDTMDVVYNGVSCPTATPASYIFITTAATAGARACTLVNAVWTVDHPFTATVAGQALTQNTPWTEDEMTAADGAVQTAANSALATAMLAAQIDHTGASCLTTPGLPITPATVTPEAAAAIDAALPATLPETVVPVLPATVPVVARETVAVPAPATVALPAAVPAGDGSTVPQVPVALLALLALATAAVVTSGLRMATNRKSLRF